MSDWSSFKNNKQIKDAWCRYLNESKSLDERSGFLSGIEYGARKAAGLGQRPDDRAPGIASKAKYPSAARLLKKQIRSAVESLVNSTTLDEYEERYVELAVLLDIAAAKGIELSEVDFTGIEEAHQRLAEQTDEEIKQQQASRNLSDRLRSMVDNYESDQPLSAEDATALADYAQTSDSDELEDDPLFQAANKVLRAFGMPDADQIETEQDSAAVAKELSGSKPKSTPATSKTKQQDIIARAKKELESAKKAWEDAAPLGNAGQLKASKLLSDFGLPEAIVRKIRLTWYQLQQAAAPSGAFPAGADPEVEPELELADDYGVDADTLRDLVAAGDLTHGPEGATKSGMEDYDTPALAGATDSPTRAAARPDTITPTADQEKQRTPMSPEELKKARKRLAKMNIRQESVLSENQIKRFKLLAGIKQ